MRGKFALLFSGILLLLHSLTVSATDSPQLQIKVAEIDGDQLIYVTYQLNDKQRVDLSELILSEQINKNKSIPFPLGITWTEVPDFKLILLQNGLAQLKSPGTADEKYRNAQEKAQKEQKGIWKPAQQPQPQQTKPSEQSQSTPPPKTTEQPRQSDGNSFWDDIGKFFSNAGNFIWKWVVILSPVGIVGIIITILLTFLWRRYYLERRIRLVIVGEPSTGKSAVYKRILNPNTDKQEILGLIPTKGKQTYKMKTHVRYAKFDIYPRLTDVPGSAFSTVWDELTGFRFKRPHALLVTLSTTKMNHNGNNVIDEKYLYTQLGYIQAFIEGGMGARKTRKPKVVVFFLNKFDLFSSHRPDDSAAVQAEARFQAVFEDHIKSATLALEKARIPFKIIIGSALENWNCDRIIDIVGKELYGN